MPEITEGTLKGGLPFLRVGRGRPLVYLAGFSPAHENPSGVGRRIALRTIRPFVRAGYQVYFVNRAPGIPLGTSFADIAAGHAAAIADEFPAPIDLLGHSTGGSLVLQLIADHPRLVRKAVVASAAYRLGPVAKRAQLELMRNLNADGSFRAPSMVEGFTRNATLQRILSLPLSLSSAVTTVKHPADPAALLWAEDGFDVYDRLGSIATETLVICGARDYFYTPELFTDTAELMPRARLVMYPRAGHSIVTKKQFFADVLNFLADYD